MTTKAQELIEQVRAHISRGDYSQAVALLRDAPADRTGWSPYENDEVACLAEFLAALNDREMSMVRL